MPTYVAIHDLRVRGTLPSFGGIWSGGVERSPGLQVTNMDANTSLLTAFGVVNLYARVEPIHALFIICHGYCGAILPMSIDLETLDDTMVQGGMGLQLGREHVMHRNVSMWTAIKGAAKNIVVYACAAADTQPGAEGTIADGRYLMGALAIHTQSDVYAADRVQHYSYGHVMNFGRWEGQLFCFSSKRNGQGRAVHCAPVELADVVRNRR
jgi:hypothetical protein